MSAPYAPPESASTQLAALESVLRNIGEVAIAVSGGVDSLTLAVAAHRVLGPGASMFHAVSSAVPAEATERTRQIADREGWKLTVLDAGEFGDSDYIRNPLNRCFYCKTNLYAAIRPHAAAQMVSGTNMDDLGEYRPGLIAAREYGVRHPFVEALIDKRGVRAISHCLGLSDVAELPASPCLSSRIETGIAIDPVMLGCVHESERLVTGELTAKTVRCRVRAGGVVIELDDASLQTLSDERRHLLTNRVMAVFEQAGFAFGVRFAPYRVGSAFLHIKGPGNRP